MPLSFCCLAQFCTSHSFCCMERKNSIHSFYYLDAERFDSKNFLRAPAWQKAVSCQRVKYDMKCFLKLWLYKTYGNVQNEQFPRRHFYVPFGEFVHLHMHYYSFANSLLKHSAFQFFTPARKPPTTFYLRFPSRICFCKISSITSKSSRDPSFVLFCLA